MEISTLSLRVGRKIMKWVFGCPWDRELNRRSILPWALESYDVIADDVVPDFLVCFCICPPNPPDIKYNEMCFIQSLEQQVRFNCGSKCFQFVQEERPGDDPKNTRYCQTMGYWGRPTSDPKTQKCSAIDSGKWQHRTVELERLKGIVGVEMFGMAGGKPLSGYHCLEEENQKYLGIKDFAFHVGIENHSCDDYITEKMNDAFLSEAVPLYWGAPNVDIYTLEGSWIRIEDAEKVDWKNWQAEYEKRRPAVLAQKEMMRRRFNTFGYFDMLTDNLSLLDNKRPITKDTQR